MRRNYFSPYVSPHGELCDKHRFTSIYSVGTCQSVLRIVAIKFFIERGWRSCCRLIIQVEKETRSEGGYSNTRENLRSEYRYPLSVNQHRWLAIDIYIYMYIRNVGTRQRFVCTMILILCTCYFVLFNTSITLTCQFRFRKFPNIIVYFRRREEKFCSLSLRFCSSWSYDEFFFVWCIQRLLTLLWKFVWDIFEISTYRILFLRYRIQNFQSILQNNFLRLLFY